MSEGSTITGTGIAVLGSAKPVQAAGAAEADGIFFGVFGGLGAMGIAAVAIGVLAYIVLRRIEIPS